MTTSLVCSGASMGMSSDSTMVQFGQQLSLGFERLRARAGRDDGGKTRRRPAVGNIRDFSVARHQ
ncbi:hypothetical protein [Xanthomonas translucens]|uniref:hypothetical protein n=1 Tax=Xanthomonas campestris pv. translucens TaxID=343 RepID=UPI0019D6A894|nr:hypothetical protein [Xanthomonas translucens]QSQ30783.1 hypothetical protein ISN30_02510 [Xanthomonas translucens pv. translucens]